MSLHDRVFTWIHLAARSLALGFVAATSAATLTPAAAAPSNMVYVQDMPVAMGGNLEPADVVTLSKSAFNVITFAFLNICSTSSIGDSACAKPANAADAVLLWNLQPTTVAAGATQVQVAAITALIEALQVAGKTVYFSIGGWTNIATWNFWDSESSTANSLLSAFYSAHKPDGFDLDAEGNGTASYNNQGFLNAGSAVSSLAPTPLFSIVPTSADASSQYCAQMGNKTPPDVVNVQYYAGGYTLDVASAVTQNLTDIQFCNSAFTVAQIVAGIAPTSTQVPASVSNCTPGSTGDIYSPCTTVASTIYKNTKTLNSDGNTHTYIGGIFVWEYETLVQPKLWASDMNTAMGQ